jgi:hypothetical protein
LYFCDFVRWDLIVLFTKQSLSYLFGRYAAQSVIRHSKQEFPVYDTIRKHFDADDLKGLKTVLARASSIEELKSDGNFGLAKLVVNALLKKRMKGLVKIFSRMKVSDILALKYADAGWTVVDVEALIVKLSTSGELSARLDQTEGIVTFQSSEYFPANEPVLQKSKSDVILALKERMEDSITLSNRIRAIQGDIHKNPAYMTRKVHALKNGGGGSDDVAHNPMLAVDMMVIDTDDMEDMM